MTDKEEVRNIAVNVLQEARETEALGEQDQGAFAFFGALTEFLALSDKEDEERKRKNEEVRRKWDERFQTQKNLQDQMDQILR